MRCTGATAAVRIGTFVALVVTLLGGCGRAVREIVPVAGLGESGLGSVRVEVLNPNGSVRVEVDERLAQPEVQARILPARGSDVEPEVAAAGVTVRAEAAQEGDQQILRVRAMLPQDAAEEPRVHLLVRVAGAQGVTVRNAGGPVELIGVTGPLMVENGRDGRSGGRIEVRAGEPVREPVRLVASEGPVFYQAPFGSSGRFDIQAEGGPARFVAKSGTVENVRDDGARWTGVLNRGSNPVYLRSGRGTARAMIIPDPVNYTPNRFTPEP